MPVVGVETTGAEAGAVPTFRRVGLLERQRVDTALGRVALAVLLGGGRTGHYGVQEDGRGRIPPIPPVEPGRRRVADASLTVLVAARDEEERIGATVAALRARFPEAEVIVADDGSRDGTAPRREAAGAIVLRLPRRGKGEALSAGERAAAARARCSSATPTSRATCARCSSGDADLAVAGLRRAPQGGGFGIVKRAGARP